MIILLSNVPNAIDTDNAETYNLKMGTNIPDLQTALPARNCYPTWFEKLSDEDFSILENALIASRKNN